MQTAFIVERLLSITGEDQQTIDRKNLPPITTTLPTRFVLISNELPRMSDASTALVGRMIVLRFRASFYGREDPRLTDELLQDLPAILWWSIDGWRKLRERGHLLQPDSSRELLDDWRDLSSPISAFIRDCCVVGLEYSIERKILFRAYRDWGEGQGRHHLEDEAGFGRLLHAALPHLNTTQPRVNGKPTRTYVGISLQ
ncbi:MAG: hypothetical protein KY475_25570 [Planctomycetes bacterium]|nr:hypothetical protein [Planctomycetota bacterium]